MGDLGVHRGGGVRPDAGLGICDWDGDMKTPHKHAELIKAWAEGAEIETIDCNVWGTCNTPRWFPECEYRIKPEPKPEPKRDVVKYGRAFLSIGVIDFARVRMESDNLRFTFCGETGVLKEAEVLK